METYSGSKLIYCRLCLKNADNTQHFIDAMANNHLIHDKIIKIFHFSLDDEANFSPYICLICCDRIESIVEFIETVLRNQEKLKTTNSKDEGLVRVFVKQEEIEYRIEDTNRFELCQMEMNDVKVKDSEESFKVRGSLKVSKKKIRRKNPVHQELFCDICCKSFISKSLLIAHMKNHIADEPMYECKTCKERFQTNTGQNTHKLQKHGKRIGSKATLYNKLVDISKYLLCDLCAGKPKFASFEKMNDHYLDTHDIRGYVRCCNRTFSTKRSVVIHSDLHSRPIDYMCTLCNKVLPNKNSLRNHIERHQPDEEKHHECSFCQKRFYRESHLKSHVKQTHDKKPQERALCVECNKTYASKFLLDRHIERVHMKEKEMTWICETCGKQCFTKGDLKSHIKYKHTEAAISTCEICGNTVKCLQIHMKIHKDAQIEIKCDVCFKKVPTYKALGFHMKIHSDAKPFGCATCGQSFKRKKALNDHMSLHSGIPRHFCNYCNRTFNNSGNKFKHIKQTHSIEHKMALERQRIIKENIAKAGKNSSKMEK